MALREYIKELSKKHSAFLMLFVCITFLSIGCTTREEREFQKAEKFIKEKKFADAMLSFENVILLNSESSKAIESARQGSKISQLELKDFKTAIKFHKFIVLNSKDETERLDSQMQLSLLYFDHLSDYTQAIEELNKCIILIKDEKENDDFRLKLAKSYYFVHNFIQAESEVDKILSKSKDQNMLFQVQILKGNIYLAKKDLPKSATVFNELLEKFPERASKENAAMTLAVTYEEMKDYTKAVQVLEKIRKYHPTPEYIDLRIKKLTQTQKNQPGARGLRRK